MSGLGLDERAARIRSSYHPSTLGLLRYFEAGHLPEGLLRNVSEVVGDVARDLADALPDGPELTTGLRKLLEAKDCLVRAALDGERPAPEPRLGDDELVVAEAAGVVPASPSALAAALLTHGVRAVPPERQ